MCLNASREISTELSTSSFEWASDVKKCSSGWGTPKNTPLPRECMNQCLHLSTSMSDASLQVATSWSVKYICPSEPTDSTQTSIPSSSAASLSPWNKESPILSIF